MSNVDFSGNSETRFNLQRGDAFRYTCNRCKKCCHNKVIHISPYEVARLARNRGQSTTEFIESGTANGEGTSLRFHSPEEGGACVFLGEEGCTVHSDRPLACRLYPLARWTVGPGIEAFAKGDGEPDSLGVFGTDGTVGEFLEGQGIEEYFVATDRYLELFTRLSSIAEKVESGEYSAESLPTGNWMDIDAVIRAAGKPVPPCAQEAMDLHIEVISGWLDGLEPTLRWPQ